MILGCQRGFFPSEFLFIVYWMLNTFLKLVLGFCFFLMLARLRRTSFLTTFYGLYFNSSLHITIYKFPAGPLRAASMYCKYHDLRCLTSRPYRPHQIQVIKSVQSYCRGRCTFYVHAWLTHPLHVWAINPPHSFRTNHTQQVVMFSDLSKIRVCSFSRVSNGKIQPLLFLPVLR